MSTIPATAKKPSDRKPKDAAKEEADAADSTTLVMEWRGHSYEIPTGAFDDVEFIERLAEIQEVEDAAAAGNGQAAAEMAMALTLLLKRILGSSWRRWKAENAISTGGYTHTPTELMMEFFNDLMEASGAGNSSASPT